MRAVIAGAIRSTATRTRSFATAATHDEDLSLKCGSFFEKKVISFEDWMRRRW